ncbi:hypothetical protein [Solimonas marina]|uniref:Uncharacterized protein n=1 Tax=Solimonas marina TaxID=2714601 RepID=A0A969WE45_9GAMM|nr:hypothetical protein [Solimonas marina]NKF23100.1 hypothetical protein [Solimonas marina]
MKGWKILVAAIVVGVGTYFGLELLLPHHEVEVKLSGLVPSEKVFGSSEKAPEQLAAADAATPGATDGTAGAPAEAAPSTDDAMADSTATPATGTSAPADTADASSAEPPADATAAAASTDSAAPAAAPEPAAEPEPAPEPEPAAAPAPEPAPAAAAPKPMPKPKPVAKPKPAPKKPAAPKVWWTGASGGLDVVYVGSASFERAIAILAGSAFASADSAQQSVHISSGGKAVFGTWKLNDKNPRMLLFPVKSLGNYTVKIDGTLRDAQGKTVGSSMQGVVYVQ